jgi:hypothetical protein
MAGTDRTVEKGGYPVAGQALRLHEGLFGLTFAGAMA